MPRHFMIGFIARSGSSAIALDLQQHPSIAMRLEVFGVPTLPGGAEQTDDNRLEWLEKFWKPRPAHDGVARGFKLQLNFARPQFNDHPRLRSAITRLGAAVFRLRRDDKIRHAVAAFRATALQDINQRVAGHSGAHIYRGAPDEVRMFARQAIHIDPGAFEKMIAALGSQEDYMSSLMDGLPTVVDITYEDYLGDRLAVLNCICDVIGVERFDQPPRETLTKNTSENWRESVVNHEEIAVVSRRLGLAG
jgi:hypothetical protein